MNTLLATNILLSVVVGIFLILAGITSLVIINIFIITKRIKHLVTVFDEDVIRTKSVVIAIKELVVEKVFGKKKK